MNAPQSDSHLLSATEAEDEMEGRLLLDVVIGEGTTILKLFSGEDESLLIGRDSLLVLNLGLYVGNGVRRLHIQGDRLAGQRLHKDLHATTEAKDEMEGGLLL